jgi:hypothetical protein
MSSHMFEILYIEDFSGDRLNTVIFFGDVSASGLFKNKASLFNEQIRLCRDTNAI